jgi:hypothetical protein
MFVKLDCSITVAQVMNAVSPQPGVFTNPLVDNIKPGGREWLPLVPAEHDLGYGGCSLQHRVVKPAVAQIEQGRSEFSGHINASTTTVLRRIEDSVNGVVSSLHMDKATGIVHTLSKLNVVPEES